MRALMIHASPPSLFTLTIVYLSSFSGESLPSLIAHQRPDSVALVRLVLKAASNSSWVSFGFAGLVAVLGEEGVVSCAVKGRAKVSTKNTRAAMNMSNPFFIAVPDD